MFLCVLREPSKKSKGLRCRLCLVRTACSQSLLAMCQFNGALRQISRACRRLRVGIYDFTYLDEFYLVVLLDKRSAICLPICACLIVSLRITLRNKYGALPALVLLSPSPPAPNYHSYFCTYIAGSGSSITAAAAAAAAKSRQRIQDVFNASCNQRLQIAIIENLQCYQHRLKEEGAPHILSTSCTLWIISLSRG